MIEPGWTAYIGVGTGIVGAITGIAGAVLGYIGYRRASSIKALDLRLELRKAISDIAAAIPRLEELLAYASRSRQAVASMTGGRDSGAMIQWDAGLEADTRKLRELGAQAPPAQMDFSKLSAVQLESHLVDMHKLKGQLDALEKKYTGSLLADDEQRKERREDVRSWGRHG